MHSSKDFTKDWISMIDEKVLKVEFTGLESAI